MDAGEKTQGPESPWLAGRLSDFPESSWLSAQGVHFAQSGQFSSWRKPNITSSFTKIIIFCNSLNLIFNLPQINKDRKVLKLCPFLSWKTTHTLIINLRPVG